MCYCCKVFFFFIQLYGFGEDIISVIVVKFAFLYEVVFPHLFIFVKFAPL